MSRPCPCHINGGFHRNGSVRSTDCHPLHGDRAHGEGPFHIEQHDGGGGHSHHTLEHGYKVGGTVKFYCKDLIFYKKNEYEKF